MWCFGGCFLPIVCPTSPLHSIHGCYKNEITCFVCFLKQHSLSAIVLPTQNFPCVWTQTEHKGPTVSMPNGRGVCVCVCVCWGGGAEVEELMSSGLWYFCCCIPNAKLFYSKLFCKLLWPTLTSVFYQHSFRPVPRASHTSSLLTFPCMAVSNHIGP